jgi:hypothetical protein
MRAVVARGEPATGSAAAADRAPAGPAAGARAGVLPPGGPARGPGAAVAAGGEGARTRPRRLAWRVGAAALLGTLLLAAAGCGSSAPSAVTAAQRARELYDRGQFREAHELLRQTIGHAGPDAVLLYNLGCALYRDGKLGEAVAAWESARLLRPRDADVAHNLALAFEQRVDRLPQLERSWFERVVEASVSRLSLDEWTLLLYGVYFLLALALGARILVRSQALAEHWPTAIFVLGAALVVCGLALGRAWADHHRERAAITAPEVTLTAGPDGSGGKVATLHAGLVVEVTGTAGADRRVRLETGWEGFLPASVLQPIGPAAWVAAAPAR